MEHVVEPTTADVAAQWHFSHAVRSRGLLLFSGVTGVRPDGTIADDPDEQFGDLFAQLGRCLDAAGASFVDLVEITTYHLDLHAHFLAFAAAKDQHVHAPYPAWSALGVAALIPAGALVELRAVAEPPTA